MSKKTPHTKERFDPKIGFEKGLNIEESLSLSDFEIEGKIPRISSFFSDSDNLQGESKEFKMKREEESKESREESVNDSKGLNHAFFDESVEESLSNAGSVDFFNLSEMKEEKKAVEEKTTKKKKKKRESIELKLEKSEAVEEKITKKKKEKKKDKKKIPPELTLEKSEVVGEKAPEEVVFKTTSLVVSKKSDNNETDKKKLPVVQKQAKKSSSACCKCLLF